MHYFSMSFVATDPSEEKPLRLKDRLIFNSDNLPENQRQGSDVTTLNKYESMCVSVGRVLRLSRRTKNIDSTMPDFLRDARRHAMGGNSWQS